MSKEVTANAERVLDQNVEIQPAERSMYRQTVDPGWSDSEEDTLNQASIGAHRPIIEDYAEPLSPPPPPYSERDYRPDEGHALFDSGVNLFPLPGGRADYVTDETGRRERYVINEQGERVPWPFPDHENSSDDGEEDPNMVYMESGRILPRSEWEVDHRCEPSSDDMSDDPRHDTPQSRRRPVARTRDRTPRYWTPEHDEFDSEIPRVRSAHSAGSRFSRRQRLARREGRSSHETGERCRQLDNSRRRSSDQC